VWTVGRETIRIKIKTKTILMGGAMEFITNDNCNWAFIRLFGLSGKIIGIKLDVRYLPGKEKETYSFFKGLQESTIIPQFRGIIIQENQIILNDGSDFELILNVGEFKVNPSDFRILYDRFSDETRIITPNIVINDECAKISVWC
jgi:hypothetical protein